MSATVKKQISTTGELRDFLSTLMVGVKDGVVTVEKASSIHKLAGQINESLYAEIKAARLQIDLKRDVVELGGLRVGEK